MSQPHARSIEPLTGPPLATIRPPGSKSLTNRFLLLAAIAEGPSQIDGALIADDTAAMSSALAAMGAIIERNGTTLRVTPLAESGGRKPVTVDARLSGTTSRFILALAATRQTPVVVDGADELRRRPMGPILDALCELGVGIENLGQPGCLPVRVSGNAVRGGSIRIDASASSQFLSALLLSAPRFASGLRVDAGRDIAARPFVDMTVDSLRRFGATVQHEAPGGYTVEPGGLIGGVHEVEVDATAATYFAAAAAITGGQVTIDGLCPSSHQGDVAFLDVLAEMGATVDMRSTSVVVTGGPLHGVDVDLSSAPDTVQTLAAVACFADSPTRVRGVGFIRGHETNRLAAVVQELQRLGIGATESDDGLIIEPGRPQPGTVATYRDHRMAMSFALIGLRSPGIRIAEPEVVNKTYPNFWSDLDRLRAPFSPDHAQ